MLRYDNGRHIAVVSRQNYPGLLANILQRLPGDSKLVGAKIFTSIESDFIIDLFEFKSSDEDLSETSISPAEVEQTIEEVAQGTGRIGRSNSGIRFPLSFRQPYPAITQRCDRAVFGV